VSGGRGDQSATAIPGAAGGEYESNSDPALRSERVHGRVAGSGLLLRAPVIGALNVFGDVKGGNLAEGDEPIIQARADVATIGLLPERASRRGEEHTAQLRAPAPAGSSSNRSRA
jgi:hypothetical protein